MKIARLGDLVEIKGGGTPDKSRSEFWDGNIPWASVKDFKSTEICSTVDSITELGVASSATNIIPAGSILLPTRMAVGKVAVNTVAMAINQDLKALTPGANVDTRYLLHALLANASVLERQATGATVKGITLEVLRGLEIPLPQLEEQRWIAAILDQADALRRKRKYAVYQLDELLASAFRARFGDPENETQFGSSSPLGELVEIKSGSTPARENIKAWGGNIPWVKTGEVSGVKIFDTEEKVTEEGAKSARLKVFPISTILIAMYGQGLTRGRVGMLGVPATVNQACSALLPNNNINMNFLFAQLKLSYQRLRALGRGGNQPNLNLDLVKSFSVFVPRLSEQRKFALMADEVERQKSVYVIQLSELDFLFSSLQHRAFNGQL